MSLWLWLVGNAEVLELAALRVKMFEAERGSLERDP